MLELFDTTKSIIQKKQEVKPKAEIENSDSNSKKRRWVKE